MPNPDTFAALEAAVKAYDADPFDDEWQSKLATAARAHVAAGDAVAELDAVKWLNEFGSHRKDPHYALQTMPNLWQWGRWHNVTSCPGKWKLDFLCKESAPTARELAAKLGRKEGE
jgi:hypothetical protein